MNPGSHANVSHCEIKYFIFVLILKVFCSLDFAQLEKLTRQQS